MKILKTLMPGDTGGFFLCDTIEHEGMLWLVPEWKRDTPSKGYSKPARVICLTSLGHGGRVHGADYHLRDPIPKEVLHGHAPPELKSKYDVIDDPEVVVESPIVVKPH